MAKVALGRQFISASQLGGFCKVNLTPRQVLLMTQAKLFSSFKESLKSLVPFPLVMLHVD